MLLRKQLIDFTRLSVGFCPYREYVMFDCRFFFSTRAQTSHPMSGGEIPASSYMSFTLVCFGHSGIALHAVLRSELCL